MNEFKPKVEVKKEHAVLLKRVTRQLELKLEQIEEKEEPDDLEDVFA